MSLYHWLEQAGIPVVFQATGLAIILILLGGLLTRRALAAGGQSAVVPDDGFSVRNILELLVEMWDNLCRDIIGEGYRSYLPLVLTNFFFVLISNFLGLLPGVGGATSHADTTWAWAIIAFVAYNYIGIRKHGVWYINQFLGPSFFDFTLFGKKIHARLLAPLYAAIEIPLHFARMLTLALRLLANMFADHTVVAIWLSLFPVAVPAIFLGLGTVISFLQAFIFALLTAIYIGMALEEPH